MEHMLEEDDEYFLPLQDQRVFGAGIKRKRVPFIPASKTDHAVDTQPFTNTHNAGDKYLSIVLKSKASSEPADMGKPATGGSNSLELGTENICPICNQPLLPSHGVPPSQPHESSITHQLCLAHSHPPSHLPREHVGLKYLSSYGWDPDSRAGLGARLEGIRVPIKGKAKNDTVGLGVNLEEMKQRARTEDEKKVVRLNAKEVRRLDADGKKRAEALKEKFYGRDLDAYLGPDG